MKNNKVLFIVTEITSANGICCINVMNELIKKNIEVYCITNYDGGKKEYIKNKIKFFTVRPRWNYSLNQKANKIKFVFVRKFSILFIKFINKIKLFFSIPFWPLISPLYSYRIYKKTLKLIKKNNISCIIPVYSQIDTLVASKKILKNNNSITCIPYLLDSLSGGYGPKCFSRKWAINRGFKWENKLFQDVNKIIMMQSSLMHYKKYEKSLYYFNRIIFLDLPLLCYNLETTNKKINDDYINILYAGSLPKGIRDPSYFLELFSKIREQNIHLIFIGDTNCDILNKYAKTDNRIKVLSKISHEEIIDYEKNADIFLNIGNSNPHMTPSKIFEYLSYGKPIISTCPIYDEPSMKYLRKYGLAYFIKEYDKQLLDKEIENLRRFIISNFKLRKDINELKHEYKNNLPITTANAILDIIKEMEKKNEYI